MKTRTWLVVGLSCALAGPLAAQAPKKGKGDLAPTIAALDGANAAAASQAAEKLGASTEPAAHDALLASLGNGLPVTVAVPAITALAQHPAPPDVAALVRYAHHRNPNARSAALSALAMYPDPVAKKAIVAGLHDMVGTVRAAAAGAAAKGHVRDAVEPLFELLARGEEPAGKALAQMADVDLARKIGEQVGKVPDGILAQTLGQVLRRNDFGPDPARVELVRAIGKLDNPQAIAALSDYLDASPKTPARESRSEAQKMVEARVSGAAPSARVYDTPPPSADGKPSKGGGK